MRYIRTSVENSDVIRVRRLGTIWSGTKLNRKLKGDAMPPVKSNTISGDGLRGETRYAVACPSPSVATLPVRVN